MFNGVSKRFGLASKSYSGE
jgi:hypothetical protein